jgi:hypothetical protein
VGGVVFALIAFYSLPSTIEAHSGTVLVLRISSELLQLVLLSIIIVGQNIQLRAADPRAAKTFEDIEDARQKSDHAIICSTSTRKVDCMTPWP